MLNAPKCHFCPTQAIAVVSDRTTCEACGLAEQKRLALQRVHCVYGHELRDGAHVRITYRTAPAFTEAEYCGRIIETCLRMGGVEYKIGMHGHGPYINFRVRLDNGTFELFHPQHLVVCQPPRLKLVPTCW